MTTRRTAVRKTERILLVLAIICAICLFLLFRNAQAIFALQGEL